MQVSSAAISAYARAAACKEGPWDERIRAGLEAAFKAQENPNWQRDEARQKAVAGLFLMQPKTNYEESAFYIRGFDAGWQAKCES